MDQVRKVLRVLWQQRFWLLIVIATITAVVCWNMAAGALDTQFAANKAKIEGQFSNMRGIAGKGVHGNDQVNQAELRAAVANKKSVLQLWQALYDQQKESVLKWPTVLGEAFLAKIEKKQFGDKSIDADMRNLYLNYINKRFPRLLKIVKAKELAAGATGGYGGGGGYGRGGGEMMGGGYGRGGGGEAMMPDVSAMTTAGEPGEDEDYLVQWLDQGLVRAKLDFPNAPTPMQMWVTQEDLWVHEAVLRVIASVNEDKGATRPDNTAIRVIASLQVGQDAALASAAPSQIMMPAGAAGDPGAMVEGGGRGDPYGGGGYGGEGGGGGDIDAALLTNRYVGEDGQPAATFDPATGGQFRKLPIQMTLLMDQKWLPVLLVKCANSPLPIEVQQVRINPDKSGVGFTGAFAASSAAAGGAEAGGGYGRGGGEMGGGGYGRGGYGGDMGGGYGGASLQMPMGPGSADLGQIVIKAVVYIYNLPDPASVAVPGEEELTTLDVAATDGQ